MHRFESQHLPVGLVGCGCSGVRVRPLIGNSYTDIGSLLRFVIGSYSVSIFLFYKLCSLSVIYGATDVIMVIYRHT